MRSRDGIDRLQRDDALRDQRQGRAGRDLAFRRDRHLRPRTAASASVTSCRTARLLTIKPDQQVKAGTVLANWDPLTRPIITEFAGKAKFENVEEGVTVAKQVDEVTGLSTLVVIDPKRRGVAKVVRPQVKLLDRGRQRSEDPRHRPLGDDRLPGRLAGADPRRPGPGAGRGAGADSGRRPEDARHHRRSAAGGRAVRGAHAEGQGHAGRDDRHGVVRQGDQGQGAAADHRPGRQGLRGTGAEGKEHPGARGPGGQQGRV